MAGGGLAAAAEELTVVFLFRPLIAVTFVLTLILLSWYVAWRTVLVHVPLVQEIAGLRRKKPAKPKPPNHGRIAKFYRSQAEAAQSWAKLYCQFESTPRRQGRSYMVALGSADPDDFWPNQ